LKTVAGRCGAALASKGAFRALPRAARAPAALMPARFMGARVPLPEPTWKQQDGIENTVSTNLDAATGLERAEMLAAMEGRNIFDDAPIGPFGTAENPVEVESIFEERIMGCPGDCAGGDTRANNEVRWFVVTSAKPYTCPTCKQVFALKKVAGDTYNF